jgi:hypothetical protein
LVDTGAVDRNKIEGKRLEVWTADRRVAVIDPKH